MFLKNFVKPIDDTVPNSVTLQFVIDKMSKQKLHHIIILSNKKPVGLITEKDIIRFFKNKIDFQSLAIEHAIKDIITLHSTRLIEYALSVMVDNNIRKIVVINSRGEYVGCIEQEQIIFQYEQKLHESDYTIHQLINSDNQAIIINENNTLEEALKVMSEQKLTSLLVGDKNKPLGIISESDIIDLAQKNIDQDSLVKSFMHSPIIEIDPKNRVHKMISKMKEKNIRRIMTYDKDYNSYHIISSKDLANSIKGNYINFLESKLFDIRDTFNAVSDHVIELIDIDNEQIIYWTNNTTKHTFNVNIDDKIIDIIPEEKWKDILNILSEKKVIFETININDRYYQLKGHYGTIIEDNIIKLFLNDITEITLLTQELKKQNEFQEKLLFNQAKMAQMGEMIGNIAHQWRQPLSIISTSATGTKLQNELGLVTSDSLDKTFDMINDNVQYLSKTIDTFRNFIKEKKVIKKQILQERIENSLNIVNATLRFNNIELIKNIDEENPIELELIAGELDQVLINIFNNAKDALVEKEITNPYIKIEVKQEAQKIIITIEDNGGGIPREIQEKVFDEYFTSKSDGKGTGLGLYMSRKIITESLLGELYFENTESGTKFFIKLPLK